MGCCTVVYFCFGKANVKRSHRENAILALDLEYLLAALGILEYSIAELNLFGGDKIDPFLVEHFAHVGSPSCP